ncbi:hypothetical protein E3O19_04700 [Cryobacterium algoritolerans]|uniref:Uncharacterized protein n=1 Tax=Cryobacterium algoritolerans TaxID=1259184 RepID=A0A4R8WVI3_9MICO|nr:hypothetical protein [Cryobacterium algoritolerans]TFC18379.1 hypothetical protein E3O19_04700 [Cryobacterium algoritolerans]
MIVLVVCGVLALVGVGAVAAWGGIDLRTPVAGASDPTAQQTVLQSNLTQPRPAQPTTPPASVSPTPVRSARVPAALRRNAWWATLVTVTGTGSGLLIAGAGGRLVMRVLALTSPLAVGRITEAQARVGDITFNGTLAFLIFGALPGAFLSSILYVVVHRWLPRGRLGGVVFGLVLLALFGTTLDPLRDGNIDFYIVGPGWLAALLFSVLVILHGMLVAAFAGWYSARLPLPTRRTWLAYTPLLAAVVYFPLGVLLLAAAVLTLIGSALVPAAPGWWTSRALVRTGRVVLVVVVVFSIPGLIGSVASITTG